VRWHDGDEVGIAFHEAQIPDTANIGLDRRLDRLEAEMAVLKQSVKQLQKNSDKSKEAA
jgi:hypothetical protein